MSMARPSSRPCSVEQRDARACAADVAGVIWEQKEEKGDSVDACKPRGNTPTGVLSVRARHSRASVCVGTGGLLAARCQLARRPTQESDL